MPNIHCRQANTLKTLSQSVPLSRHPIHLFQTTSISACYLVVLSTFNFAGKVAVVVVLNSAIKLSANWSVSAFRSRLELKNKAHKRWRSQVRMTRASQIAAKENKSFKRSLFQMNEFEA